MTMKVANPFVTFRGRRFRLGTAPGAAPVFTNFYLAGLRGNRPVLALAPNELGRALPPSPPPPVIFGSATRIVRGTSRNSRISHHVLAAR